MMVNAASCTYLLGYENDSVRVLDEQTGTLSKLPAGATHLWAIAQVGSVLYVTHVQDTSMEAINVETHATQSIATGAMPCALAGDDRNELFVANYAGSSISIIDTRAGTTVATLNVGGHPQAIAVDTEQRLLYVAEAQESSVSIIDIQGRRVLEKLKMNGRPYALSVDSRTHRVIAATAGSIPYKDLKVQREASPNPPRLRSLRGRGRCDASSKRLAETMFHHNHQPLAQRQHHFLWHLMQRSFERQKCQPVNCRPRKILRIFAILLAEQAALLHSIQS